MQPLQGSLQLWGSSLCACVYNHLKCTDKWQNMDSVPGSLLGIKVTNVTAVSLSHLGLRRTNSLLSAPLPCYSLAPQPHFSLFF